LGVSGCGV